MTDKIKYIPISLFIIGQSIFDIWSPGLQIEVINATNAHVMWSIFYFVMMYAAWLIHCIYEAFKLDLLYFGTLGMGLIVRIIIELSKLNMTYDQYIHSVNSFQSRMILTLWIALTLLIPLIKWKRYKKEYKY